MRRELAPTDIQQLVDRVLASYQLEPIDVFDTGNAAAEYEYLSREKSAYCRTLEDIVHYHRHCTSSSIKILEIGAFLGFVSIALSMLGFQVTASDVREIARCSRWQQKLTRYDVRFVECNLRHYALPFDDEAFDTVIICETLEHLNFNPLPVIKEINRVMKQDGLLYLALPNIASRGNRLRLLQGESIHNPIRDFFSQLEPNSHASIGIHWREYTMAEVREMLEPLGFATRHQRYVHDSPPYRRWSRLVRASKRLVRAFLTLPPVQKLIFSCLLDMEIDPSMQPGQVTLANKTTSCHKEFHFTDVVLPD